MLADFFDPTPEEQNVLMIERARADRAATFIESCEICNPDGAEIPFDVILDHMTGSDPRVTDYILETPAKCPYCRRAVLEKTLIEPAEKFWEA